MFGYVCYGCLFLWFLFVLMVFFFPPVGGIGNNHPNCSSCLVMTLPPKVQYQARQTIGVGNNRRSGSPCTGTSRPRQSWSRPGRCMGMTLRCTSTFLQTAAHPYVLDQVRKLFIEDRKGCTYTDTKRYLSSSRHADVDAIKYNGRHDVPLCKHYSRKSGGGCGSVPKEK